MEETLALSSAQRRLTDATPHDTTFNLAPHDQCPLVLFINVPVCSRGCHGNMNLQFVGLVVRSIQLQPHLCKFISSLNTPFPENLLKLNRGFGSFPRWHIEEEEEEEEEEVS